MNRRNVLCGTLPLAALLVLAAGPAHADADSEREALSRIAQELQRLKAQVALAARSADTTARIKFRYDWLAKDLELVQRGIADHLDAPRQPRPVSPLAGDYRR